MTVEFSVGLETLKRLVAEFSPLGELSNEAQTRFSFVDRLLKDCLGWSEAGQIRVEVFERGDRTDYECGQPRQLIVEAKKASAPFKFPPRGATAEAFVCLPGLLPVQVQQQLSGELA
jgi:hypothetical protein